MTLRLTAAMLAFIAIFAVAARPAPCEDVSHDVSYIVTLTNGNTLEANSYRVERDTVYLMFPVGEAAFKKSLIRSIVTSEGKAEMFQTKGDEQRAPERPEPARDRPEPGRVDPVLEPVPTIPGPATLEERRRQQEERREMIRTPDGVEGGQDGDVTIVGRPEKEDPQQDEINNLVDDFFETDDKDEEKLNELEEKLDNLFE